MEKQKQDIMYCGYGIHYDMANGERVQKTASGSFIETEKTALERLEHKFINEKLENGEKND